VKNSALEESIDELSYLNSVMWGTQIEGEMMGALELLC
jgi:hypothetical protein